MEYYLRGKGADEPPYNLFKVDHVTGLVSITSTLDWETHPSFHVSAATLFIFYHLLNSLYVKFLSYMKRSQ